MTKSGFSADGSIADLLYLIETMRKQSTSSGRKAGRSTSGGEAEKRSLFANSDPLKSSLLPLPEWRSNASPDPLAASNHAQAKDGGSGPDGDFGIDGRTGDGADPERLRRICEIDPDHAKPGKRDEGQEGDKSGLLPVGNPSYSMRAGSAEAAGQDPADPLIGVDEAEQHGLEERGEDLGEAAESEHFHCTVH